MLLIALSEQGTGPFVFGDDLSRPRGSFTNSPPAPRESSPPKISHYPSPQNPLAPPQSQARTALSARGGLYLGAQGLGPEAGIPSPHQDSALSSKLLARAPARALLGQAETQAETALKASSSWPLRFERSCPKGEISFIASEAPRQTPRLIGAPRPGCWGWHTCPQTPCVWWLRS